MAEKDAKFVEFNCSKEEEKTLLSIAKSAQKVLHDQYYITISLADAIPTIAFQCIYEIASYLEKNKSMDEDVVINFMNLINVGVTYREGEDGEKTGNFTPFIQAGPIFKTIIKSDDMTEDED